MMWKGKINVKMEKKVDEGEMLKWEWMGRKKEKRKGEKSKKNEKRCRWK